MVSRSIMVMEAKPESTRFFTSSQPIPPAPTTSTCGRAHAHGGHDAGGQRGPARAGGVSAAEAWLSCAWVRGAGSARLHSRQIAPRQLACRRRARRHRWSRPSPRAKRSRARPRACHVSAALRGTLPRVPATRPRPTSGCRRRRAARSGRRWTGSSSASHRPSRRSAQRIPTSVHRPRSAQRLARSAQTTRAAQSATRGASPISSRSSCDGCAPSA